MDKIGNYGKIIYYEQRAASAGVKAGLGEERESEEQAACWIRRLISKGLVGCLRPGESSDSRLENDSANRERENGFRIERFGWWSAFDRTERKDLKRSDLNE